MFSFLFFTLEFSVGLLWTLLPGLIVVGIATLIRNYIQDRKSTKIIPPLNNQTTPLKDNNKMNEMLFQDGEFVLGNAYDYPFEFDGYECKTMESFLQSLKFDSIEKQKEVLAMSADDAVRESQTCDVDKIWIKDKCFYWKGRKYEKNTKDAIEFLYKAYFAKMMYGEDMPFLILQKAPVERILTFVEHDIYPGASIIQKKEHTTLLLSIKFGRPAERVADDDEFWTEDHDK